MGKAKKWDLVISSKKDWFNLDIKNIWRYRDLIIFFIKRDIATEYKQTILGVFYHALNPIISTFIKVLIFGKIANLSTDGIPQFLFYLSGGIFWSYFARCLAIGKGVFLTNRDLYSQVYIPKLAVPIANNISEFFKLIMQIVLFISFFIYFYANGVDLHPSVSLVFFIPLLFFQCSLLGLGFGLLLSSFTTRYRDLNFLGGYINSFWMYSSPVVYPLSVIPEKWHYILSFNPMVGIIEFSRHLIFGTSSFQIEQLVNGLITTIIFILIGLLSYNRVEKTFLDTV
tara:strand:+ start:1678 stop:2529 length:852 start_codon:yes stop_codon:yes gene_type:complete